jgi:DNA (cytosine-5)-methyltransferase 1
VRRLTPLETERLQGLPDNWTLRTIHGKQSDSARYRQIGNAVALPVAQWVISRLIEADADG